MDVLSDISDLLKQGPKLLFFFKVPESEKFLFLLDGPNNHKQGQSHGFKKGEADIKNIVNMFG